MSSQSKAKSTAKRKNTKSKPTTPTICWFEIPADDPQRAKKFYGSLFGWKIEKFPGAEDYWHIDTGSGDRTRDGGLILRKHPEQFNTNYVAVPSVDDAAPKVEKLGGTICKAQDRGTADGLFRHLPGYGRQRVRPVGSECSSEIAAIPHHLSMGRDPQPG